MAQIDQTLIAGLKDKACETRKKILKLGHLGGTFHFGGDLSMTDVMVALFHHVLKRDPKNPTWPEQDRFVLSKI
jgi:transketolase